MSADAMTEPEPGRGSAGRPSACPVCNATVRHDVPWCLQCYASLGPAPQVGPASAPSVEPRYRMDGAPPGGWAPSRADAAEVERVAEQLLAELSASSRTLPSWWSRLPTSSGARAAWVVAAIATASLALVLVMALVGQLL